MWTDETPILRFLNVNSDYFTSIISLWLNGNDVKWQINERDDSSHNKRLLMQNNVVWEWSVSSATVGGAESAMDEIEGRHYCDHLIWWCWCFHSAAGCGWKKPRLFVWRRVFMLRTSSSTSPSSPGSLRCHYQLVSPAHHDDKPTRALHSAVTSRMSNPAAAPLSTNSQLASDQTRSNEVGNAIRKTTAASNAKLLTRFSSSSSSSSSSVENK